LNIYITSGTIDYLQKLRDTYPNEVMLLMDSEENTLLLHESSNHTFFKAPRGYEVIVSLGTFCTDGLIVMHHIPVSDEARPIFEHQFISLPRLIKSLNGLKAIRLLRPLSSNTFIILTQWENQSAYEEHKAILNSQVNKGIENWLQVSPKMFTSSLYISKYNVLEMNS